MNSASLPFSAYQRLVLSLFMALLFTVVVDFLLLQSLSAELLKTKTPEEFAALLSSYAISAAVSGWATSLIIDRFNRKSFLLVVYAGFLAGLLLTYFSNSYSLLVLARVITGIFGGVIATASYAIITHIFKTQQRGKAMGWVQLAFALAQIGGLPLALFLTTLYPWKTPFLCLFLFGLTVGTASLFLLKSVPSPKKNHQQKTLLAFTQNFKQLTFRFTFLNNALLVSADVLFMTFNAAFMVNNLGITEDQLPIVYFASGASMLVVSPFIGQLTDQWGRYKVYLLGAIISVIVVVLFTQLTTANLLTVAILQALFFIGMSARMIASTALTTSVPTEINTGSFLALDASFQQIANSAAATLAGSLLALNASQEIENYSLLGGFIVVLLLFTTVLVRLIDKKLNKR